MHVVREACGLKDPPGDLDLATTGGNDTLTPDKNQLRNWCWAIYEYVDIFEFGLTSDEI